ncbi:MAG: hypothetical protein NT032_08150 [Actinobacteria bacterium]|nr:hypothetical protein [Actinomycetota bacterium]
MGPQKFTASNTAEALKMVKAKMGPDAMVLSTKDTDQGVEILAITPEDLSNMSIAPLTLCGRRIETLAEIFVVKVRSRVLKNSTPLI